VQHVDSVSYMQVLSATHTLYLSLQVILLTGTAVWLDFVERCIYSNSHIYCFLMQFFMSHIFILCRFADSLVCTDLMFDAVGYVTGRVSSL